MYPHLSIPLFLLFLLFSISLVIIDHLCFVAAVSKAVFSLARGLRDFPHALPVLSLRNCGMTASGFSALANGLRANPGMALTIEELDLSHNQGTNAILQWFNEVFPLLLKSVGLLCS